jgi:hypothetical protein
VVVIVQLVLEDRSASLEGLVQHQRAALFSCSVDQEEQQRVVLFLLQPLQVDQLLMALLVPAALSILQRVKLQSVRPGH